MFCFLNFVKWGKYLSLNLVETSKMYCCRLFYWKSNFYRYVDFKLRAAEYAIPFFLINHLKCFSRDFCQKVYEETILFQLKFQKSIPTCSILKKIRMFNFVILKWWPFKYKVKNWKMCSFLGLFFSQVKNADNLNFSWIKYFGNDFPFLIKYHVRVYYCWTSFWCFQCYFWNQ